MEVKEEASMKMQCTHHAWVDQAIHKGTLPTPSSQHQMGQQKQRNMVSSSLSCCVALVDVDTLMGDTLEEVKITWAWTSRSCNYHLEDKLLMP
eukprot:1140097-Amphidinium_carterae.2